MTVTPTLPPSAPENLTAKAYVIAQNFAALFVLIAIIAYWLALPIFIAFIPMLVGLAGGPVWLQVVFGMFAIILFIRSELK